MSVLMILLGLAIFGLVVYLITTFIPMTPPVKSVIIAIAVIVLIIWLLQGIGLIGPLNTPLRVR